MESWRTLARPTAVAIAAAAVMVGGASGAVAVTDPDLCSVANAYDAAHQIDSVIATFANAQTKGLACSAADKTAASTAKSAAADLSWLA